MLSTEQLLNGLPGDLTLRFFAAFSRFEFALKFSGCLTSDNIGAAAQASRDKLRTRLPADFFDTVAASGRIAVLIEHPPKNLTIQEYNQPAFGAALPPLHDTEGLLNAVWRVRNNLFHGNKMFPANRERDSHLMLDVLAVIDLVLAADIQIASAFNEPQQFF